MSLQRCESPCCGADGAQLCGNFIFSSHIQFETFIWVNLQSCGADVQQPAFF